MATTLHAAWGGEGGKGRGKDKKDRRSKEPRPQAHTASSAA
jgi:hypothetical protein